MTSLAVLQDLEDIWRPITDTTEIALYGRLLDKASALLRAKAPNLDDRLTAATLDPVVVATVVAQIVKRYAVNPDGVSTKSQTVGPYSESKSYVDRYEGTDGSASMRGGLQVTKTDLDALRPEVTAAQIGTIRVHAGMAPVRGRYGTVGLPAELLSSDIDDTPISFTGTP